MLFVKWIFISAYFHLLLLLTHFWGDCHQIFSGRIASKIILIIHKFLIALCRRSTFFLLFFQIKDLSEEHISHLVKMTRDFSMVFYKVQRAVSLMIAQWKISAITTAPKIKESCAKSLKRGGLSPRGLVYFCLFVSLSPCLSSTTSPVSLSCSSCHWPPPQLSVYFWKSGLQ